MKKVHIQCPKKLDQESGRALFEQVCEKSLNSIERMVLDFTATKDMDTRGGAWLLEVADYLRARSAPFENVGQEGKVAAFLRLLESGLEAAPALTAEPPGTFELIGQTVLNAAQEAREFFFFLIDTVYWTILGPFEGHHFRWGSFIDELHEMGVRAFKIVFLMNFLLGVIVAMLAAAQLNLFGASIYVADLVMIAFGRELAAVMTAVVISARTGAATAAELATMKVQEELDALRGMGLHVGQFIIAPKILALVVVLPIMTGLGMIAGVGGGTLWALLALDFQADVWFAQTLNAAAFSDLFQGISKAFVFAVVIILIGCHNGMRVTGGARGVGLATTRAVVMDIFFIVVIDMIFAAIFYYAI